MNAYVKLSEIDQGVVYIKTLSIEAITTYGSGSQVYTSGYDTQRYTVEESPEAVFKLMQESEVANIIKIDEVEDQRSQRLREAKNEV